MDVERTYGAANDMGSSLQICMENAALHSLGRVHFPGESRRLRISGSCNYIDARVRHVPYKVPSSRGCDETVHETGAGGSKKDVPM